ncbi:MAG: ThuA domain-containing protein [Bacteroidota bacterium]|nr:ThuA domain-containing protein [Bacteroidota bacterium]
MKYFQLILLISCLFFTACDGRQSHKILIITGGHEYDRENFVEMFESFEGIEFDEAIQPEANQIYASDSIDQYDVLVYYDMVQEISEEQKSAFLEMMEQGKGIVFLHHSLASYQDWDEFLKIRGGRYDLETSTYAHGQDIVVKISDPKHPITKGLEAFKIHEETYNSCEVLPGVHPLIQIDHPGSEKIIGWTNKYGKSRIVYLQPGHDNNAFSNSGYRRLVQRSIVWAGGN